MAFSKLRSDQAVRIGKAGDDNRPLIWPDLNRPAEGFRTVDSPRHYHIQDQEVRRPRFQVGNRRFAALRDFYLLTHCLQQGLGHLPLHVVIIDCQNNLASTGYRLAGLLFLPVVD